MKILKPGKVERRKFVCQCCGCIFVAMPDDCEFAIPNTLCCPQEGCDAVTEWNSGEPYEEPTLTLELKERLYGILLTANPNATTTELTDLLFENGVTFREG